MLRTLRSLSTKAKAHSGLQLQVIALYRKLLRTSVGKERVLQEGCYNATRGHGDMTVNGSSFFLKLLGDGRSSTFNVSHQFRKEAESVSKRDIDRIEYGIRRGEKYVKLLKMGGVKGFQLSK